MFSFAFCFCGKHHATWGERGLLTYASSSQSIIEESQAGTPAEAEAEPWKESY